MQRTPNLNLPQFEPTDKYSLDDYNEAYMTLDEKIKEAQDLIATWTQFKANGGEIGGELKSGLFKTTTDSNGKSWGINNTNSNFATHYYENGVWKSSPFSVERNGQIWAGNFSHNVSGYTALPNGMIIQWGVSGGRTNEWGGVYTTITFPIRFPVFCASVTANCEWIDGTDAGQIIVGVQGKLAHQCTLHGQAINSQSNKNCSFIWIAIGY